jgi:hypothetical protein
MSQSSNSNSYRSMNQTGSPKRSDRRKAMAKKKEDDIMNSLIKSFSTVKGIGKKYAKSRRRKVKTIFNRSPVKTAGITVKNISRRADRSIKNMFNRLRQTRQQQFNISRGMFSKKKTRRKPRR